MGKTMKNRFRDPRVPGIRVRGQHTKTTGRHRAFAAMDGGKKKWEAASREKRWNTGQRTHRVIQPTKMMVELTKTVF